MWGIVERHEGEGEMKKQESINDKSSVQDFADTLESNPAEIIAWAKREIFEVKLIGRYRSGSENRFWLIWREMGGGIS